MVKGQTSPGTSSDENAGKHKPQNDPPLGDSAAEGTADRGKAQKGSGAAVGLEFAIKPPLEAGQARGNAIPSGNFPDWLV